MVANNTITKLFLVNKIRQSLLISLLQIRLGLATPAAGSLRWVMLSIRASSHNRVLYNRMCPEQVKLMETTTIISRDRVLGTPINRIIVL